MAKMMSDQERMEFGDTAEALQDKMRTVDTEWDNPYLNLSKVEAQFQHENGQVTDQDANDWQVANQIKGKGLWNLSKEDAMYAHSRGFVNDDQANAYIEYQNMHHDINNQMGLFILTELSRGKKKEEIMTNFQGLEMPIYGPEDLVADILSGGTISLMRTGIKGTIAATAKTTAKAAVVDAGFGMVAGGAMAGADYMTDSKTVQLLAGFLSPLGASVLLSLGRNGMKQMLKSIKKNNPELSKAISESMEEVGDGDDIARLIREELGEAEIGLVKEPDVVRPQKDNMISVDADTRYTGVADIKPAKVKIDEEQALKQISIVEAIREGKPTEAAEAAPPSKLVENIEKRGDVEAIDLVNEVRVAFKEEIELARRGGKEGEGTTIPNKAQEIEATAELKKVGEWTGNRLQDMKKIVGWGENLQVAITTARRQTRAFNRVFSQYSDEIRDLIINARTFEEELKALSHLQLFGRMTKSVYGVRAEWGRGTQAYNMPWMKTKFDFDSIPTKELKNFEKAERNNIRKVLNGFKDAKDPRLKALRARSATRGRFLLGMLELEQAFLLSDPRTQLVNIAGNAATLTWRNTAAMAATSYDAWKIAGGIRKPLTMDEVALRPIKYQVQSLWQALVDSLRLPRHAMVDAFKLSRSQRKHIGENIGKAVMEVDEVGTVWKALWSGEAQLDRFSKYAEESKGALPDDINDIMIPFAKGKKIGETRLKMPRAFNLPIGNLIRLPFHGLTAGDELFKTLNYRQAMHELAYREVAKNHGNVLMPDGTMVAVGMDPKTVDRAVKLQLENATDEMTMEALKVQRRETFTNELDKATGGFEQILNAPVVGPLMRLLFTPFYKITVNLPKYALQQTPLGYAAKWQRDAIKQGGKARYEVMARWTMGTSLLIAGVGLYATGKITGRVDNKARGAAEAAGVQPYSFTDEDGMQSDYSRIEPAAYLIGMGADIGKALGDTMEYLDPEQRKAARLELNDVIMSYCAAFTAPILEKSVARSAKEALDLALAPDRMNWDKFKVKQYEKFMPRIIDFAVEMAGHKEVMRESRSLMEAWNRKWGTLADENERAHPKRHIVYGTPVMRQERALAIINQKQRVVDDPIVQEMWRVRANPVKLADEFTVDGITVDLEGYPEVYDAINDHIMNSDLKIELQETIDSEWYQASTDQTEQADELLKLIREYRREAQLDVFDSLPEEHPLYRKYQEEEERNDLVELGLKQRRDKHALGNFWTDYLRLK